MSRGASPKDWRGSPTRLSNSPASGLGRRLGVNPELPTPRAAPDGQRPKSWAEVPKGERLAIVAVGVILAFCLTVVLAVGHGSKTSITPAAGHTTTIAAAAWPGAQLQATQDDLLVTSTLPKQTDDAEYVSELGELAKRLALAVRGGAPDLPANTKTLSILALRPDLDRLGNPGAHSFAMLIFDVSDLKGAHVDRLGAYGVLDLAKEVRPVLPWQLAIGQWCQFHDRAPNFCLATKRSLGDGVAWNGPE
jgi:hypothetical protein